MASAVDADAATHYLARFTSTTELLAPLKEKMSSTNVDPEATKKIQRATLLRSVIKAKLPDVKGEDLKTMSTQYVHGLLDATFPLESALVDDDCADDASLQLL